MQNLKIYSPSQSDFLQAVLSHQIWLGSKGAEGERLQAERWDLQHLSFQFIRDNKFSLEKSEIIECNLNGCDLSNINFYYANLACSRLIESNLTNCDFTSANFDGVNMLKAITYNANFENAYTDFSFPSSRVPMWDEVCKSWH